MHWQALEERSARATLSDGPRSVSLTFVFGDDDLIETVRADARARAVAGRMVPTPWEGRWSNYRLRDGMRVGLLAWHRRFVAPRIRRGCAAACQQLMAAAPRRTRPTGTGQS